MNNRDKYGNYVNDKGVTINVHTDKNGKDHLSFYEGPIDGNHSTVHVNIDYDNGKWNSHTHGLDHSDSDPSGDRNCFLTTACMKVYAKEFDDNCYELQTLRWFRDTYVSKEDITHYYRIAPIIVQNINLCNNHTEIYTNIYNQVIRTCIQAIKCKNYDLAYQIYRAAVLELEQEYAR